MVVLLSSLDLFSISSPLLKENVVAHEQPSVSAQVNVSPSSQEAELSIKVMLEPLEVTCDPDIFLNFMEFYNMFKSFDFHHKRGLGSRNKRRMVKDFLRNKDWVALPVSGASGGILIIWDSKNLRREEVVIGSFSISVKFSLDGCGPLWISAVYGPNSPSLRKIFGWNFLTFMINLSAMNVNYLTHLFGMLHSLGQICKSLPCVRDWTVFSTQMSGAALPQGLQEALIRRTSDHWPIVMDTNPFRGDLTLLEKLYTNPTGESWGVEGLDWSLISEESALRLDSPFHRRRDSKAIFQLDRDKALGPDGFTIAVFQECWDVIKEDLVRVFAEFHRSGIINQSTNASFIVLIPKKCLSKRISDFRPISLITSLYKIIAKVLFGRLRGVLHETIHYTQGAFVQGRQILHAVLIAMR
ncbi:Transposon TX1 uncharacterized 149 kDa protein [Vitis vinifera]|uniref:Transposon TX1 uncharacterized 149 kDa protein n=1 Tax=Vitis vinifera TaxID=29760 RepID=A0A438GYA5_VITVI|nr:Transposon TX1 uncharacterized 149 kDa protein [Vitis vinifera]